MYNIKQVIGMVRYNHTEDAQVPELHEVVDIDPDDWEELQEDFWMSGLELARVELPSPSGYAVPMDIWHQGEATSYADVTGDTPSPTPTHKERERYWLRQFNLSEWIEATEEERERMLAVAMEDLLQEVTTGGDQ